MAQLLMDINSAAANASRDRAVYNKIDVRLVRPTAPPTDIFFYLTLTLVLPGRLFMIILVA